MQNRAAYLKLIKHKITKEGITNPLEILFAMLHVYKGTGLRHTFYYPLTRNHMKLCKALLKQKTLFDTLKVLRNAVEPFDKEEGEFIALLSAFFTVYKSLIPNLNKELITKLSINETTRLEFVLPALFEQNEEKSMISMGCALDLLPPEMYTPTLNKLAQEIGTMRSTARESENCLMNQDNLPEEIQRKLIDTFLQQSELSQSNLEITPEHKKFWLNLPRKFLDTVIHDIYKKLSRKNLDLQVKINTVNILGTIWPNLAEIQKNIFEVELFLKLYKKYSEDVEIFKPIFSDLTAKQRSEYFDQTANYEYSPILTRYLKNGLTEAEAHAMLLKLTNHPKCIILMVSNYYDSCSTQDRNFLLTALIEKIEPHCDLDYLNLLEYRLKYSFTIEDQREIAPSLLSVLDRKEINSESEGHKTRVYSTINNLDISVLKQHEKQLLSIVQVLQSARSVERDSIESANISNNIYQRSYLVIFLKTLVTLSRLEQLDVKTKAWFIENLNKLIGSTFTISYETQQTILGLWPNLSEHDRDGILEVLCQLLIQQNMTVIHFFYSHFQEVKSRFSPSQTQVCTSYLAKVVDELKREDNSFLHEKPLKESILQLPAKDRTYYILRYATKFPDLLEKVKKVDDIFVDKLISGDLPNFTPRIMVKICKHIAKNLSENQKIKLMNHAKKTLLNSGLLCSWEILNILDVKLHNLLETNERVIFINLNIVRILAQSLEYQMLAEDTEVACLPGFYQPIYNDLAPLWTVLTAPEKLTFVDKFAKDLSRIDGTSRKQVELCMKQFIQRMTGVDVMNFMMMLSEQLSSRNPQLAVDIVSPIYRVNKSDCEISFTLETMEIPTVISDIVLSYTR